MGAFDWSVTPAQNSIADALVRAIDGASARDYPGLVRGVQAGVAALAADQGGALVTAGAADAYTVSTSSGVKAMRAGVRLVVKADRDSQQAPTFAPDGLAPRPWLDASGQPARVRQGRVYVLTADPDRGWISDALPALGNGDLAAAPAGTLKGRSTGSAGAPQDLGPDAVKSLLALVVADVAGLPAALAGKTSPADIAATLAPLQSAVTLLQASQSSSSLTYDTLAQLNANLAPADGSSAQVINDGTNSGFYVKSGAANAGSWVKKSGATVPAVAGRLDTIDAQRAALFALAGLQINGRSVDPRDALPYVDAIVSTAGRVFMAFTDAGGAMIPRIEQPAVAAAARDERRFLWTLDDGASGRAALARELDGMFVRLSGRGARDVGGRLTPDPTSFRGSHNPFNLRYGPKGTVLATRQDPDRTIYDVVQIEGGLYDTAAAFSAAPLPHAVYFGQSQAGGGGSATAIITDAPYPRHCLGFDFGRGKIYGGTNYTASAASDLVPLQDGPTEQGYISTLYARFLERQNREAGPAGPGIIVNGVSQGGAALNAFVRGSQAYTDLITACTLAPVIGARYLRRTYTDRILFVQGEAGPYGRSAYATALAGLIDQLRPDVQALNAAAGFSVAPQIFLTQQNQFDTNNTPTNTGVKLGQLDVALARLGQGVTLLGPMYQSQVQGDGIHMDNPGKALVAELHAHVTRRVMTDGVGGWNPLWPASLVSLPRTNAVITLDVVLPPGTTTIAKDADWVLAPADGNWGFAYTDDSGAPPAIQSVAIGAGAAAGQARLVITLAATPTGANRKLRYALGSPAPTNGWLGERGLVYADSGVPSRARETFPSLPATIRHYLVGFEATVA